MSVTIDYDGFAKILGNIEELAEYKGKKLYKLKLEIETSIPSLLPAEPSDPDAKLTLDEPIETPTKETEEGEISFSQVEWLIEVKNFRKKKVSIDELREALAELSLLAQPLSYYGHSAILSRWQYLDLWGDEDGSDFDEEDLAELGDDKLAEMGLDPSKIHEMVETRQPAGKSRGKTAKRKAEDMKSAPADDDEEWMDEDEDRFDRLIIAVPLLSDARYSEQQSELVEESDLYEILDIVKTCLKRKLKPAIIKPRTSIEEGVERAARLVDPMAELDEEIEILLKAPSGEHFDALTVYDTMLSLGLEYSPEEGTFAYHPEGSENPLPFFTVSTSTYPVEFNPVDYSQYKPQDLKFGFFFPYSIAPKIAFELSLRAAQYSQKRLGGELLDGSGDRLDIQEIRTRIDRLLEACKKLDLIPGTDELMVYL
eukprot:Colp12_sorted_trinity150504_noHs@10201